MQSGNHYTMPLSQEICIAFLEEYLLHRQTIWNTSYQVLFNKIISRQKERQTVCADFIERIKRAKSLSEKEDIIKSLGEEARAAQNEKMQTSTSASFLNWTWNAFCNVFAKDNSLFSKTCHAVRTKMIASILLSKEKETYYDHLKELRKELKRKDEIILSNIQNKLETTKIKADRYNLFVVLLDLQDPETIQEAALHQTFPAELPKLIVSDQKNPSNIKFNPNIPIVYDINYCAFFFENEIKTAVKRINDFNQQLKNAMQSREASEKSNTMLGDDNILSENYFMPMIHGEELILNPSIEEKTKVVQPEKKIDNTSITSGFPAQSPSTFHEKKPLKKEYYSPPQDIKKASKT